MNNELGRASSHSNPNYLTPYAPLLVTTFPSFSTIRRALTLRLLCLYLTQRLLDIPSRRFLFFSSLHWVACPSSIYLTCLSFFFSNERRMSNVNAWL